MALEELDNLSEKEKLKQTRQNNKLGQIWRTRLKTILRTPPFLAYKGITIGVFWDFFGVKNTPKNGSLSHMG